MTTIKEIERDAREELRDWLRGNPGDDPECMISELAKGAIPCYHYDVLELAQGDFGLLAAREEAYHDPEKLIGANIYDRIYAALTDELGIWQAMTIDVYYGPRHGDNQDEIADRLYEVLEDAYPEADVDVIMNYDEKAERILAFASLDTEEVHVRRMTAEVLTV